MSARISPNAARFETRTYTKGDKIKLSANFDLFEFDCPCSYPECTTTIVDDELVFKLQRLRDWVMRSVEITSGFRCAAHHEDLKKGGANQKKNIQDSTVPTVATNSQHLVGKAADIWVHGYTGAELEVEAREIGFMAVGVAKRWIHVDTRTDARRRWVYTG
jgi:uncharacterized protein YcbK (DUF882 family)